MDFLAWVKTDISGQTFCCYKAKILSMIFALSTSPVPPDGASAPAVIVEWLGEKPEDSDDEQWIDQIVYDCGWYYTKVEALNLPALPNNAWMAFCVDDEVIILETSDGLFLAGHDDTSEFNEDESIVTPVYCLNENYITVPGLSTSYSLVIYEHYDIPSEILYKYIRRIYLGSKSTQADTGSFYISDNYVLYRYQGATYFKSDIISYPEKSVITTRLNYDLISKCPRKWYRSSDYFYDLNDSGTLQRSRIYYPINLSYTLPEYTINPRNRVTEEIHFQTTAPFRITDGGTSDTLCQRKVFTPEYDADGILDNYSIDSYVDVDHSCEGESSISKSILQEVESFDLGFSGIYYVITKRECHSEFTSIRENIGTLLTDGVNSVTYNKTQSVSLIMEQNSSCDAELYYPPTGGVTIKIENIVNEYSYESTFRDLEEIYYKGVKLGENKLDVDVTYALDFTNSFNLTWTKNVVSSIETIFVPAHIDLFEDLIIFTIYSIEATDETYDENNPESEDVHDRLLTLEVTISVKMYYKGTITLLKEETLDLESPTLTTFSARPDGRGPGTLYAMAHDEYDLYGKCDWGDVLDNVTIYPLYLSGFPLYESGVAAKTPPAGFPDYYDNIDEDEEYDSTNVVYDLHQTFMDRFQRPNPFTTPDSYINNSRDFISGFGHGNQFVLLGFWYLSFLPKITATYPTTSTHGDILWFRVSASDSLFENLDILLHNGEIVTDTFDPNGMTDNFILLSQT